MLIAAPWFVVMRWIHESVFYDYLLVSETKKSIGISLLNIGSNATVYTKNWFLYFFPTSWILTVGLLDRIRNANGTDETEQRIVRFL